MKKIINVILVLALIVSVGFNIYFYREINRVTKIENDLIEEIDNLGIALEESKETLENKDIEITELEAQISDKEEEINGITETVETLKAEKEEITNQLEELKDAPKQETTTKKSNTDNNGKTNNGEQSSTQGGQGNSQTGGAPGGDANVPNDEPSGGMSLEDAAAARGAEFIGSGGSVGRTGSGGYGIQID